MRPFSSVLCWFFAGARSNRRSLDAQFLWPALAKQVGRDATRFMEAAQMHCDSDPAWAGYEHEWFGTPQSPFMWWREHMQTSTEIQP